MQTINIRHMLDESLCRPVHRRFASRVRTLGRIISCITASESGIPWDAEHLIFGSLPQYNPRYKIVLSAARPWAAS